MTKKKVVRKGYTRADGTKVRPHETTVNAGSSAANEMAVHATDGSATTDPVQIPPTEVRADGTKVWKKGTLLHRDDGPAFIAPDGTQSWFQNGRSHRDDGPAVIRRDGTQHWFQNGFLHRDDGPAIVRADGFEEWFQHGKPVAPRSVK